MASLSSLLQDPRIELRATKSFEAFEGELAVCMGLSPSQRVQAPWRPVQPYLSIFSACAAKVSPAGKKKKEKAPKQPEAVVAQDFEARSNLAMSCFIAPDPLNFEAPMNSRSFAL